MSGHMGLPAWDCLFWVHQRVGLTSADVGANVRSRLGSSSRQDHPGMQRSLRQDPPLWGLYINIASYRGLGFRVVQEKAPVEDSSRMIHRPASPGRPELVGDVGRYALGRWCFKACGQRGGALCADRRHFGPWSSRLSRRSVTVRSVMVKAVGSDHPGPVRCKEPESQNASSPRTPKNLGVFGIRHTEFSTRTPTPDPLRARILRAGNYIVLDREYIVG